MIESLFRDITPGEFVQSHYLKLPFSSAGTAAGLADLGTMTRVQRLLQHPNADVLIGRQGTQRPGPLPQTQPEIETVLREGHTIGLRHVDRIDDELRSLAVEFEHAFAAATDIHLYATPAGQPGFGWHYDAEDVFVLQTSGDKEWRLRKNTVNPWPVVEAIPANQRYEREIMPVMTCRLAAGDWLYIPAGYWHQTQAGEVSISLSIGLQSPTALDVYDFLRTRLVGQLEWRQRLPPFGDLTEHPIHAGDDIQAAFVNLAQDLSQRWQSETLLSDFASWQRDRLGREPRTK